MTLIEVYFLFGDNQGEKAHDKDLVKRFVMFKKKFQEEKIVCKENEG